MKTMRGLASTGEVSALKRGGSSMANQEDSYFADLEIRLAFTERKVEKMKQEIDQLETRFTSTEGKLSSLIRMLPVDLLQGDAEESSP
ncbi:MAG: hypothetical protein CMJ95_10085 [Planctomycetes bacterium]|nr:hypothetical protein [Planctomycetota bacterium]MAW77714.1 hypothetical protein [Planctomycetota bacterium]